MKHTTAGTKESILNISGRSPYMVGVEIGSYAMKVVGLNLFRKPSLAFYSVVSLPKEHDDSYIAKTIRNVLKDNKFSAKEAVLNFSDDSVTIRRIEIPYMARREEALDALRWQAVDMVNYEMSKATLDFEIIGETEKENGAKFMQLLFVAVSRESIDRKIAVLKDAGLTTVSVNVPAFGLENIMKVDEGLDLSKAVLVVDFGYKDTEVSIVKNGKLEFVRTIHIGSWNITDVITRGLVGPDGKPRFTESQAEDVKRELGIAYQQSTLENGVTSIQILSQMRSTLEWLSKEIKRSIEYYAQEYGGGQISGIYLAGGGSQLKNLDRYLSEELKIPARKMAIPKQIDTAKAGIKEDDGLSLAALIGSLIGYKTGINLLPHEYKTKKLEAIESLSVKVIAVVVAIGLLIAFANIKTKVVDADKKLKSVVKELDILKVIKEPQARFDQMSLVLSQAMKIDLPAEKVMRELSILIPRNIVLNNLSLEKPSMAVEMTGVVFAPSGQAEKTLTEFMENLENSKYFRDAELGNIQVNRAEGKEAASSAFTISCFME